MLFYTFFFQNYNDSEAIMSFAVNGEQFGRAYSVSVRELKGQPLFPHILTKNVCFEVNFGTRDVPWFPAENGYIWAAKVPLEQRISGPRRPENREDCEVCINKSIINQFYFLSKGIPSHHVVICLKRWHT